MDESTKSGAAPENTGRKSWLGNPLVIPALATAVFGLVSWGIQWSITQRVDNAQRAIQQQIEVKSQELEQRNRVQLAQLQSQLSVREEFYKRRLAVYQTACERIAETESSLADYGVPGQSQKQATDAVKALNRFKRGNQLYWSQQLGQQLDKLWELGITKMKFPEADDEQLNEAIAKEISDLHEQMKQDLDVPGMSKAYQDSIKLPQADGNGPQEAK
jgi:hypothetical protein